MSGYSVNIRMGSPTDAAPEESRLAMWYAGIPRWLSRLEEQRKVHAHSLAGGYPDVYTAFAGDLLPVLAALPELQPGPEGDRNRIMTLGFGIPHSIHRDRMAACTPDQMLTLELWDQS